MDNKKFLKLRLFFLICISLVGLFQIVSAVDIETILLDKASLNPDEIVSIVVDLETNNEGVHDEIREATKNVDAEIDTIGEEVRVMFRNVKEDIGYYENEEETLELLKFNDKEFMIKLEDAKEKYGFTNSKLQNLGEMVDGLRDERTFIVSGLLKNKYQRIQNSFVNSLDDDVLVVYQDYATNKVVLQIKAKDVFEISNIDGVHEIIYGEWPDTNELDVSVDTIGANTWHNNGITGGSSKILFLSLVGINISHPALEHINFINNCFFFGCDPTNPTDSHDTAVAGIIGSNDISFGGVAPLIIAIANAQTNTFSSSMEGVDWSITELYPASSASDYVLMSKNWGGGNPPYCGDEVEEEYVDDIVDMYDVNWIKSAGNIGANPGYNGVTLPAGAYNIMAIGASDDMGNPDRSNDEIWFNSSRGPVEICGSGETRIKPDIVAPGKGIISAHSSGGFYSSTGTSNAAPHVAASLVLVDDGFPGLVTRQSRALLLNTAEDRDEFTDASGSDGPDNKWGYGYLDMDRAYLEADDNYDVTITGEGTDVYFKVDSVDESDKATMVWNRHIVSNNGVTNNLDLFLYDEVTGNLIDSSEYVGRNIEQVVSGASYSGGVIKVNFNTLNTGSAEDFGIAYNGLFNQVNEPSFVSMLNIESILACDVNTEISVNILNEGDLAMHDFILDLNLPDGLDLVNGNNPQNIDIVNSGSNIDATWIVKSTGAGDMNFSVDISSQTYGEMYIDNLEGNTYIGSQEVCFDGVDNDCDGYMDEGCIIIRPGSILGPVRAEYCSTGSAVC